MDATGVLIRITVFQQGAREALVVLQQLLRGGVRYIKEVKDSPPDGIILVSCVPKK